MLKKEKEYKIYRLVLDGKVVYVGQTTKKYLNSRKSHHNYIETFERVKESEIELIEITTDITRERYWIEYYLNEGCVLFNKHKGLTGLTKKEYEKNRIQTEERKQWRKEYEKKRGQTEEYKNYQKAYRQRKKAEKLLQNQNNNVNFE